MAPKMFRSRGSSSLPLKFLSSFLRFIEFCCAAIILGIFSYYLSALSSHSIHISSWIRAVEGIAGAALLYTIPAMLLVFCLGGIAVLSVVAMLLDLGFMGAFVYVAWKTRAGRGSCNGVVNTPLGSGDTRDAAGNQVIANSGGVVKLPSLHTACKLETACFAVAIVAVIFFFLSLLTEILLIKHHRSDKKYGPSPLNNYTDGKRPSRSRSIIGGGLLSRFSRKKGKNLTLPDPEKNPDMLMATHPAPEPGHAHGDYIPPMGTALADDNAVDHKYGHGAHHQGMAMTGAGAGAVGGSPHVGGGDAGAGGYGNMGTPSGYTTTTQTTTTTGTRMSPPPAMGHPGYKADF